MKIQIFAIAFLILLSCGKTTNKEVKKEEFSIDSTSMNSITIENSNTKDKIDLEFSSIAEILEKNFGVKISKIDQVHSPLEGHYYKLIDSNKIKEFRIYPDFAIIEFNSQTDSENEFNKIKSVAQKSLQDKKELFEYDGIFMKGGITLNKIDRWIISHFLRCSMTPQDYQTDKDFTSDLEELYDDVDWIRSNCGWTKLEIK